MTDRLRLLAYSDATEVGGAEISLRNLLAKLPDEVDVSILATDRAVGEALAAARPGTPVSIVPAVRDKADLRAIAVHLRALRAARAQVLHANLRTPYTCQYAIAAGILTPGTAVVAVEHLPLATTSGFRRRLKRLLSARLDAHIAVGDATARFVERDAGLPAGSVATIRNGVPVRTVDVPPPERVRPLIGSVGRLDAQKGFDVLVAALALLPDVDSVVVGEGPERERLEAAAKAAGVADRFTLLGRLDDPLPVLAGLDAFVLPSRFEGLPLVILEAMLAGVPVVATDVGSTSEAVADGETGLIVPPEDPEALASAVRRLLDDPALRDALRTRALARARQEFTADAMAQRYLEVYRRAAGRAPRRRVGRAPQGVAPFVPGDVASGYYNDLTPELGAHGPDHWLTWLTALDTDRAAANPVSVAQRTLAAWQRRDADAAWTEVFRSGSDWLLANVEEDGTIPYRFDLPHTYPLRAPWVSAMAQGQAASVFARAAVELGDSRYAEAAATVCRPLVDPESPLVAATDDGPVLQEYPTQPPSHVLNGWIFALWGLHDAAAAGAGETVAAAFAAGTASLAARIRLYDLRGGWSRYDLYPHSLTHVASPFYHRLHVAQLDATARLSGRDELAEHARQWEAALGRPLTYTTAVARKAAFRGLVPRRRRA